MSECKVKHKINVHGQFLFIHNMQVAFVADF